MNTTAGPMTARTMRAVRQYLDAKSVLTVYLTLCFIPSYLTITVIGALGRPTILMSLAMLAWWLAHQLQRPFPIRTGFQPLRWMIAATFLVVLTSYALAMFRGIPAPETSPADTGLVRAAGWVGLFLVAHDGLRSWENLLTTIRRVVVAGGLMAVLGLLQFFSKSSLLSWFAIPGMSGDGLGGIDQRGGFVRAAGTAAHPLEYGMVLCIALPLALTLAMADRARHPLARWWPATAIAAASILSVSRSALLAVAVAIVVLAFAWNRRQRLVAALVAAVGLVVVWATVPGMAGTMVGMFTGAGEDSSVASRVSSYDVAFGMVSRLPVFGRGFGTLLPTYVYLDNQYLGIVVELGIVGLTVVLTFFGMAALLSWRAARRRGADPLKDGADPLTAQLGAALAAALCSGTLSFTFFDALSFPLSSGFMFLALGLAGAYCRIVRAERAGRSVRTEPTIHQGVLP